MKRFKETRTEYLVYSDGGIWITYDKEKSSLEDIIEDLAERLSRDDKVLRQYYAALKRVDAAISRIF